jgi:hypothetical protein
MTKNAPFALSLSVALLLASCTVYKVRDMDAKALAALKPEKGKILAVKTKADVIEFPEGDPAKLSGAGIVGHLRGSIDIDPTDIADLAPAGKRAKVVLRGGDRIDVVSSRPSGDVLQCEFAKATWIPLDEVVRAKVKTVDAAGSILSTLAGVVLIAGALALDSSGGDEDEYVDDPGDESLDFILGLFEPSGERPPRESSKAILGSGKTPPAAEESKFWIMEWKPVDPKPGEDGKIRVRLDNRTGAPRGVDEAKLVAVDHPPGLGVAPDSRDTLRTFAEPVPPASASDGSGRDIAPLLGSRDDDYWRNPWGDQAAGGEARTRDTLALEFPRPARARRAKLVVNAANSAWRAEFAREAAAAGAGSAPVYQESEFVKLRVMLQTVLGWQVGQVFFAAGPLPAETAIYDLDLDDVDGASVRLRLTPPSGYWLIDRLAIDFSEDAPIEEAVIDAESADGPSAAEVLSALAAEDGTTAFFEDPGQESVLTFAPPPPKEGMARTLFLRTVSCYEMPPRAAAPSRAPRR